jgi:hypothetical protein
MMSLESLQKRVGDVYQVVEGQLEKKFETAVTTVVRDEVDHVNFKLVCGKNNDVVVKYSNIENKSNTSSTVVNVEFTYKDKEAEKTLGTATFILLSIDAVKKEVEADLKTLKINQDVNAVEIPVHKYVDIKIPNTALKKLLTSSVTTRGMVTEAAAEEALRVKLAALNIEKLKETKAAKKTKLTVEEQLQLMISEAFDGFIALQKHHLWMGNYPVGQEATKIFEAMSGLLEDPTSVPHYRTILKYASQVNGHREWPITALGILLLLGGSAISIECIVFMFLNGISPVNGVAFFGLAMLAGGIVAICASKPHAQSAELYKVGDAASACQPGWFSSVFSSAGSSISVPNTSSLHNTTPPSLPLSAQKS